MVHRRFQASAVTTTRGILLARRTALPQNKPLQNMSLTTWDTLPLSAYVQWLSTRRSRSTSRVKTTVSSAEYKRNMHYLRTQAGTSSWRLDQRRATGEIRSYFTGCSHTGVQFPWSRRPPTPPWRASRSGQDEGQRSKAMQSAGRDSNSRSTPTRWWRPVPSALNAGRPQWGRWGQGRFLIDLGRGLLPTSSTTMASSSCHWLLLKRRWNHPGLQQVVSVWNSFQNDENVRSPRYCRYCCDRQRAPVWSWISHQLCVDKGIGACDIFSSQPSSQQRSRKCSSDDREPHKEEERWVPWFPDAPQHTTTVTVLLNSAWGEDWGPEFTMTQSPSC